METAIFLDNDLAASADDATLLSQLQGNILRGYRRLEVRHVFIRFTCTLDEARAWVGRNVVNGAPFAPTTAAGYEREIAAGGSDVVLRSFLVTADGIRYFGKSVDGMCPAFARGSRHEETLRLLNDPSPDDWPDEYRSPWHAVVLLAGNSAEDIRAAVSSLLATLEGNAQAWQETGAALGPSGEKLKDVNQPRHEHFGFRDGLSQPVYLKTHWAELGDFYGGGLRTDDPRDPRRPVSTVLVRDQLARDSTAFASYFVYRKLQQDVTGFQERLENHVATLQQRGQFLHALWGGKVGGRTGYEIFASGPADRATARDFALSRMMGRSVDGVAVTAQGATQNLNDFDFSDDPEGRVCPFSAHTRKMNPRGLTGDLAAERRRTLARRSWPFGTRDQASGRYKQDVGLLFFCAQASIERQFEPVQRQWANAEDVDLGAVPTPSLDSLIGQRPQSHERTLYVEDRHRKIGETIDVNLDFYDLVKLRGAEYLYAPSLTGIQALSAR
jgi:deferrochelatase/peroxidase EfeB